MRRTENILQIDGGKAEWTTVEVPPEAVVEIPSIQGKNNVNQLKHHLDVERMSKSRGNVVNPDELVERYGADTVRGYLMFAFDWAKGGPWDSQGIMGVYRFLNDVWRIVTEPSPAQGSADEKIIRSLRRKTHQTIQRVTRSLESFNFNTGMAALMEQKNLMQKYRGIVGANTQAWKEAVRTLLLLMAPYTPHVAEELWAHIGGAYSVHQQSWPIADPEIAADEEITLVVQVNGKVRDRISLPADITEEDAKQAALASMTVQQFTEGKPPKKIVVIPGKLVNIVV